MKKRTMKSKLTKQYNNLKNKNIEGRSTNNKVRSFDHEMEDDEKQIGNSECRELVLYDPIVVSDDEAASLSRRNSVTDRTPKVSPFIEAYTVQCANCYKWRLIPTMEKYEEIRECIIDKPFLCEAVQEWQPEISCDDPPDVEQDASRVWAIDKPSIPRPPSGWQRILKIRGEGGTKFADVFYDTPSGKRLRSMTEVQRFLDEHPEFVEEGILSKFSFQIPKPLHDNYVQKRAPRILESKKRSLKFSDSPHPAKVACHVYTVPAAEPLAWMEPDSEIQLGTPSQPSQEYYGSPPPEGGSKKRKVLNPRSSGKAVREQNKCVGELLDGSMTMGIGLDIREEVNIYATRESD